MHAKILLQLPEDYDKNQLREWEREYVSAAKTQFGDDIEFETEWLEDHEVQSHIAGHYGKRCTTREEIEKWNRIGGWSPMIVDSAIEIS